MPTPPHAPLARSQQFHARAIREEAEYGGVRVRLSGRINNVRLALQIDVGFGDAVTPNAEAAVLPVLLEGLDPPTLRVYPVYTVLGVPPASVPELI